MPCILIIIMLLSPNSPDIHALPPPSNILNKMYCVYSWGWRHEIIFLNWRIPYSWHRGRNQIHVNSMILKRCYKWAWGQFPPLTVAHEGRKHGASIDNGGLVVTEGGIFIRSKKGGGKILAQAPTKECPRTPSTPFPKCSRKPFKNCADKECA